MAKTPPKNKKAKGKKGKAPKAPTPPSMQQIAFNQANAIAQAQLRPLEQNAETTRKWLTGLSGGYQDVLRRSGDEYAKQAGTLLASASQAAAGESPEETARKTKAVRDILGTGNIAGETLQSLIGKTGAKQKAGEVTGQTQAHQKWLERESSIGNTLNLAAQKTAAANLAKQKQQVLAQIPSLFSNQLQGERNWAATKAGLDLAAKQFGQRKFEFGQELDLKGQYYDILENQEKGRQTRANQKEAAKKGKPSQYANLGIPKELDSAVHAAQTLWERYMSGGGKRPWRTAYDFLRKNNLSADQSAMVATLWTPSSLTTNTTPGNILKMLSNRGVSKAAAKKILGPQAYKYAVTTPLDQQGFDVFKGTYGGLL